MKIIKNRYKPTKNILSRRENIASSATKPQINPKKRGFASELVYLITRNINKAKKRALSETSTHVTVFKKTWELENQNRAAKDPENNLPAFFNIR